MARRFTMATDDPNPYLPPVSLEVSPRALQSSGASPQADPRRGLFLMWPCAVSFNIVLPAIIAWSMTETSGRLGIFMAIGIILVTGWCFCYVRPVIARRMITGSLAVALMQFFPILHIFTGLFAFMVVEKIGLSGSITASDVPDITTFVVTMIVGSVLLAVSLAIGTVFALIHRYWVGDTSSSPSAGSLT